MGRKRPMIPPQQAETRRCGMQRTQAKMALSAHDGYERCGLLTDTLSAKRRKRRRTLRRLAHRPANRKAFRRSDIAPCTMVHVQKKRDPEGSLSGAKAPRASATTLPSADYTAVRRAMAGLAAGFGMGPGDPRLRGRARAGRCPRVPGAPPGGALKAAWRF